MIYSAPEQPEVHAFTIGASTLPAAEISYADGQELLGKLKANGNLMVTLKFAQDPLPVDANRIASFSSRGPDPHGQIRPDVTAVVSSRGGFFNVWGVHVDPIHGKPVSEPFPVTHFENPSRMATPVNQGSEMSLSANRLALPITELSGSIWVLDNATQ